MFSLLPGMVLLLPLVLLSIHLGNRFGLRSWVYAVAFGAAGAVLYYALLLGVVGNTVGASPWLAVTLAAGGAVAGYVYFVTERVDREGRRRPTREVVPPMPPQDQ